jgi:hypothetical protein
MAPRKKAGPNVGSCGSCFRVQVSDKQWVTFSAAIDPDLAVANSTILPNGLTLQGGLQQSIAFALDCEGGPTTREIRVDLARGLSQLVECYMAMLPETRDLLDEAAVEVLEFMPYLKHVAKNAVDDIRERERDNKRNKHNVQFDPFLADIIWLICHCPGIRGSLPSKANYDCADEYAIYRGARTAVRIAYEIAEQRASTAAPKLKRLRDCSQSTFVSKLLRARRGFPFVSLELSVGMNSVTGSGAIAT